MAQEFTSGRFKSWLDSGLPNAGGRLYTYASGTTTFLTAYTDATLSTPCTYTSDGAGGQYIALNARGEAQVWFGTSAYTFVVKDASGVTIWSIDGVTDTGAVASSSILASLASSVGATLVGFLQSGTGAILRTLLAKLFDFPITPQDFGAKGDGTTDDTTAILAANTYATSKGKVVYFPAATYVFSPSASTTITVGWRGESQYNTIINVANTYAGEVLRLQTQASLESLTLQTPGLSRTTGAVGVRVAGTTNAAQNVNTELRRLYIRGFDRNIDLQNVYVLHADHCQIESGNYGVYCSPDATTYGFITTHTWVNCDFGNNGVSVYYNSSNYSNTVTFIGGNISGATGAYQAYFNKLRVLKFINTYFEASTTIRALYFNDVDYVSLDGGYINGTGGIQVGSGSPSRFDLRNVWCTSATDVLTGADGNQMLSMHACNFPSTGNSALNLWKTLTVENTNYNGQFLAYIARGQSFGFKDTQQSGGGTVAIDMVNGDEQRVTALDAAAFAIGAPTNAVSGQTLDVTVQNSAGAPMGAITWNAVFKLAGWVNPATGFNRTIRFRFDGGVWHMVGSPPSTDVPN